MFASLDHKHQPAPSREKCRIFLGLENLRYTIRCLLLLVFQLNLQKSSLQQFFVCLLFRPLHAKRSLPSWLGVILQRYVSNTIPTPGTWVWGKFIQKYIPRIISHQFFTKFGDSFSFCKSFFLWKQTFRLFAQPEWHFSLVVRSPTHTHNHSKVSLHQKFLVGANAN